MAQNKVDYSELSKATAHLQAEMQDRDLASAVQTLLKDWLEAYQGLIINRLKTCPVQEMEHQRNLLVASEAFNDFLTAVIANGDMAEADLKSIMEAEAFNSQTGFYPE